VGVWSTFSGSPVAWLKRNENQIYQRIQYEIGNIFMKTNKCQFQRLSILFLMVGICVILFSGGCGLKKIHEQTKIVENTGVIKGQVKVESNKRGPVYVIRYRDKQGVPIKESKVVANDAGHFEFSVIPGSHYIGTFIDSNKNGSHQPEEHGTYYGYPTKIDVTDRQVVTLDPIIISGPVPKPEKDIRSIDKVSAIRKNIGRVTTLDDPRFIRDNYNMGLWKPFDFLDKAEGGLFFLQKYEKDKIPVIFVHGVMGGPTDFAAVLTQLDKQKFQPWVLFYPSGIRIDMISSYFVDAVSQLQDIHNLDRFYVIAHSMGGLVTRSFVKKYIEHSKDNINRLRLVMTINSPMNGMAAAASGVKHSPIVVPSWRDVEPGSEFLQDLHTWNWPKKIPYHLVISYTDGEDGDGVVQLQSQSQFKLQSEATRVHVFNNDHVGTLSDKDFLSAFNQTLRDSL